MTKLDSNNKVKLVQNWVKFYLKSVCSKIIHKYTEHSVNSEYYS